MEMDKMQVVWKNQKELRCGYTTGSCAAAAAKAAAAMLFSGEEIRQVSLMTPKGIELYLEVEKIQRENESVSCAIQKDSGDDPDVTNGIFVYAKVTKKREKGMTLDGGIGVGRFTRKVLEQEAGEAAINKVPRQMIREAVQSQIEKYDWDGGADVLVYVPQGVEIAKKTFNPRLGIEGGISVLGTSGIVEPMSEQALVESILLELRVRKAAGERYLLVTPGNYGADFIRASIGLDPRTAVLTSNFIGDQELAVKCSNYIGDAIDDGVRLKMDGLLLVGHIGKLVKIAAGVMNTHSRQADARMEVLAVHAAMAGADRETVCALMKCFTTKEALDILEERGLLEETMRTVMEKIEYHLAKRAGEKMKVGALMFSDELGVLGKTSLVDKLREKIG